MFANLELEPLYIMNIMKSLNQLSNKETIVWLVDNSEQEVIKFCLRSFYEAKLP